MWKIRHLSNLEPPKSHGPHRNSEELGTAPLPDVHLQQLGQFRLQLQGLIQLTKVRHVQILQPRRTDGKKRLCFGNCNWDKLSDSDRQ